MKVDGKLIRRLRLKSGWSATYLAQQVEISPQFLSDVERGQRGIHPATARKIADLLEVDLEQLFPPSTKGVGV